MFCAKCGANVPDGVKFCGVCGEPMPVAAPEAPVAPVAPAYAAPVAPAKKNNKMVLIIIAVVAAVAVLLGCLLIFGKSGAEAALDDYFDAYIEGDFSNVGDLMPELAWNDMGVQPETLDSEIYTNLWLAGLREDADDIDIESIDYEVLDVEEIEGKDLQDVIKSFSESKPAFTVEEACTLWVELSGEYLSGEEYAEIETFNAVKIDGDWYILNGSSFAAKDFARLAKK